MEDNKLKPNNDEINMSNGVNETESSKTESNESNETNESNESNASQPYIIDLLAVIGVLIVTTISFKAIVGVALGIGRGLGLTENKSIQTIMTDPLFNLFSYAIPFIITIIFAILLFSRRGYSKLWPKLSFNLTNAPLVLYGFILVLLSGFVLEPALAIFPDEWLTKVNQSIGRGGWAILTAVVMAPILEEILFRGVIQRSAMFKYGALGSILISSAAFGIIHIVPQQIIYAFVVGVILGYIYWKTNSILSVITIHAMNNGLTFILITIFGDDLSNITMRSLIKNDTLYWIVYSILTILFITALIVLIQQINKIKKKEPQPEENKLEQQTEIE